MIDASFGNSKRINLKPLGPSADSVKAQFTQQIEDYLPAESPR